MPSIADFFVSLGMEVDTAKFTTALIGVTTLTGAIKKLAGAAIDTARDIVFGTADAGQHIKDLSDRTGVNAQQLQKLAFGASLSGVGIDQLAMAMNRLAKGGVNDVQGYILKLADQMKGLPNNGARARLAMEKMGRAGGAMVPWLSKGSDEIERLGRVAQESGAVLDGDALTAAHDFNDSLRLLDETGKGLTYTIGIPLLKSLKPVVDGITDWVIANRKLIGARVVDFLNGMGAALGVVWRLIKPVGSVLFVILERAARFIGTFIGSISSGIQNILDGFGKLSPRLKGIAIAGAITFALWLAPILATVAAIGLIGLAIEDVWTYFNDPNADTMTGLLVSKLKEVAPKMLEAIQPFFDQFWLYLRTQSQILFGEFADDLIVAFQKRMPSLSGTLSAALAPILDLLVPGGYAINAIRMANGQENVGSSLTSSIFGGGASPAASTAAASGSTSNSSRVDNSSTTINMTTQPGQSHEDIAGDLMGKMNRAKQTEYGAAQSHAR